MKLPKLICIVTMFAITSSAHAQQDSSASAKAKPPSQLGGITLPPGFRFTKKDPSRHGETWGGIAGPDGFDFEYSIWPVAKPGMPRHSGNFVSDAKRLGDEHKKWYKERRINGELVHLTLAKWDRLMVSYPKRGVNLAVNVKGTDQLTDALLIAYSIPSIAKKQGVSSDTKPDGSKWTTEDGIR